MEYTLIEQLLGTVFVILLVIFIIGKKLGVKWFSTFKMWYKGTWKEEWEKKQTMKEKELTLVGWKELPLYLFHPRMFISKEWPWIKWSKYDHKTNTLTWYHWVIFDSKKIWNSLLHISITILTWILKFYLIAITIFYMIIPIVSLLLDSL